MGSSQSFEKCFKEFIHISIELNSEDVFYIKLIEYVYTYDCKDNKTKLTYEESIKWSDYISSYIKDKYNIIPNVEYYEIKSIGEFIVEL